MKKILMAPLTSLGREVYIVALVYVALCNPAIMRFTWTGFKLDFLTMVIAICIGIAKMPFKDREPKEKKRLGFGTMRMLLFCSKNPTMGLAGASEDFVFLGIPATLIMLNITGWWVVVPFSILFAYGHGYKSVSSRVMMVFEQIFLVWVAINYGLISTFVMHYIRDMLGHWMSKLVIGKRKKKRFIPSSLVLPSTLD